MSEAWGASRPADHQYKDWPLRVTYLVSPEAKVVGAWEVKDLRIHPAEVLELLQAEASPSD